MLNEKALEAAFTKADKWMRLTARQERMLVSAITAYLAALPSSPVRELVEALRGCAQMVREGKYEMLSEFWYDETAKLTAEACTEAADRLTALEAKLAEKVKVKPLDPDMPAQQLRMHLGEMTAQEMRTARAAIRLANSAISALED